MYVIGGGGGEEGGWMLWHNGWLWEAKYQFFYEVDVLS